MKPDEYNKGFANFYGRTFFVNQNVLIPRIETEKTIDGVKKINPKEIVDVGTGSGCIGITLKLELPHANVTLLDISEQALEVAKINAQRLGAEVEIKQHDLLDTGNYDLVVANLPYIPHKRIPSLDASVRDYEPHLALDGGKKGLEVIYKLLDQCRAEYIILEIDDTHTLKDFEKYKINYDIKIEKDIFKRNRYVNLRRHSAI